jgi:hypothetical protein
MAFSPETYREAAYEHIKVCIQLHGEGKFLLSHYVAGLAVECTLRAYQFRKNTQFDGRHNIQKLYLGSGFDRMIPKARKSAIIQAIVEVDSRWSNSYRFLSTAELRRRLLELKLNRGISGDLLEGSSRRLLDSAFELVQLGELKWPK